MVNLLGAMALVVFVVAFILWLLQCACVAISGRAKAGGLDVMSLAQAVYTHATAKRRAAKCCKVWLFALAFIVAWLIAH